MNNLLIKIKRKLFFFLNKFTGLFNLELKEKNISNEQLLGKIIDKNEIIIFDVGANIGQTILRYRKIFPKSIIYSFEPSPKVFKTLKQRFKNYENLHLFNYALGVKKNSQNFYVNERSHNSGFFKLNDNFKIKNFPDEKMNYLETINVEVKKLDELMDELKLNKIHILKIDTEGYEKEVLNGALETLENKLIDYIELEIILGDVYKNKEFSFREIENIIYNYGYRLFSINKSGNLYQNPNYTLNAIFKKKN